MRVKFVKDLEFFSVAQRQSLYELEWPLFQEKYDGTVLMFDYVVISAVNNAYAHETYIFPSDQDGKVLDWSELDGSYQGGTDHGHAIQSAGWTLVEEF